MKFLNCSAVAVVLCVSSLSACASGEDPVSVYQQNRNLIIEAEVDEVTILSGRVNRGNCPNTMPSLQKPTPERIQAWRDNAPRLREKSDEEVVATYAGAIAPPYKLKFGESKTFLVMDLNCTNIKEVELETDHGSFVFKFE